MKRRKILKNASVVALSAVVMCGAALTFAGCKPKNEYELSVFIFCSDNDATTNKKICDDWAKDYTARLRESGEIAEDQEVTVNFDYLANTEDYFRRLDNDFADGEASDIIYLSPRNVKAWRTMGRVLDITEFLSEDDAEGLNGIWPDALSFYGYTDTEGYVQGDKISFKTDGAEGMGLYTEDNIKVGLYGLPKDYSNFAMAYNGKFYTKDMMTWMTKYKPTTTRSVKGANFDTANLTFRGGDAENDVITYAVDVSNYTNPYTGETINASAGDPAPFILPGVPLRYKPYNFYKFENYNAALDGGDPIVAAAQEWAPDGYVVTIPGFPGETITLSDTDLTKDPDAAYYEDVANITFTYAEFGALIWATNFFTNTFNWFDAQANGKGESALTSGTGGIVTAAGLPQNVYGCGQYEGSPGATLYMLPWLYSNDSDFINEASNLATNPGVNNAGDKEANRYNTTDELDTVQKMIDAVAKQQSEPRLKLSLNGEYRTVDTYYGVNSYNFLETYGAFLECASTWNANSENAGDSDSKSDNSWANFRNGHNITYGSGTWDAQQRNNSDLEKYCEYRTMPSPVSEKYALYSHVKDAFYNTRTYSWVKEEVVDGKTVQTIWNGEKEVTDNSVDYVKGASNPEAVDDHCKVFSADEIKKNQIVRQDKWGARMDSVGYAVNGALKGSAWKAQAAASLVIALSIDETAQLTLSYGGAQLPNFIDQCEEFLYYNIPDASYWTKAGKTYDQGAFNKMLTPEGFFDTGYFNADGTVNEQGAAKAAEIWNYYYGVVKEMDLQAVAQSSTTVKEFLAGKTDYDGTGNIRYDTQYDDVKFSEFAKSDNETSYRAFAMKVLYMQTYTRTDRDLQIRMQYGINSARDSAMYTYKTDWINRVSTRDGSSLAYMLQSPTLIQQNGISAVVKLIAKGEFQSPQSYQTAAVHCLTVAQLVADDLQKSLDAERTDMEAYQ